MWIIRNDEGRYSVYEVDDVIDEKVQTDSGPGTYYATEEEAKAAVIEYLKGWKKNEAGT